MKKNKSYTIEVKKWVWWISFGSLAISAFINGLGQVLGIMVFLMWMANIKIKEVKE